MDRSNAIERQHANIVRRQAESAAAESSAESHPLLRLQRQVGNAQIARLLAQRHEAGGEEAIQAMRLQRQGEEEEELQASRLQRQGEEEEELQASRLQRQGEEEEELQASRLERQEDEDELAMSRLDREPEVGLAGGPVSDGTASRISSMRGSGSPLDDGMRASMESSFDTSFSDVRVHSGSEAASLNRSISGRAFTTGSDIFLGESASASDSHLLAHELTHVVQQRDGIGGGGPMSVTAAGDVHEQEAESTASAVSSGNPAPAAAQRRHEHQD